MSFFEVLREFLESLTEGNRTITACEDQVIDHYKFYQFSLIPAVVLTLMFASTKTRRQRLKDVLGGRPGLIYPMDTLTRESRISYCCAFGATAFLVYQILLEQKFAIDYHGPVSLITLIAILTMFVYGIVFFPVFACVALNSAFSYFFGSLYVWMFFIVDVYNNMECDLTPKGRVVNLARSMPSLGCLGYLSISLPIRFFLCVTQKQFFTGPEKKKFETLEEIKNSYQGLHVSNLLKPPEVEEELEGVVNSAKQWTIQYVRSWLYYVQPGFRYPTQLVSVLFVAFCVIYMITVELTFMFVELFDLILANLDTDTNDKSVDFTDRYYVLLVKTSLILAIFVTFLLTFLQIMHMLSSFRSNLFAMYKGDFKYIPSTAEKSAVWLCTGSIKYAGFQVAYIVWAYVIQWIVLSILFTIIIYIFDGHIDVIVREVSKIWPGLVVALVLMIIQMLLAKFVFLQNKGQHLRLDNRHFYFIFAYFMFFYNIFLGLFSCLFRILKAIAIGAFFLARLDRSTLPRKFEYLDPGLQAYIGYIHLEAAHTHPVANVFIRILVSFSERRRPREASIEIPDISDISNESNNGSNRRVEPLYDRLQSVNVSAKFKWFLTYTLLHNPQVRIFRRGYMQAAKKARKGGLRVPISDKPISPFDIVQLQREREETRQASGLSSSRPGSFSLFGPRYGSTLTTPANLSAVSRRPSAPSSRERQPEKSVEVSISEEAISPSREDTRTGVLEFLGVTLFPAPVVTQDDEDLLKV